jgi:hypothetical protein
MAKWSTQVADARKRQALNVRIQEAAARLDAHVNRRIAALQLLRRNGWGAELVAVTANPGKSAIMILADDYAVVSYDIADVFRVTPPGGAWIIVRGIEALERKTRGMS